MGDDGRRMEDGRKRKDRGRTEGGKWRRMEDGKRKIKKEGCLLRFGARN